MLSIQTAIYIIYTHVDAYITSILHILFIDIHRHFSKLKHFLFHIANLLEVCNIK